MTLSGTLSWYIVQFKPNCHKIAVRNLQGQGVETFLPMHEVTRRTVVKFETVPRPLFAGYMSVSCDPETAPWSKINSTYGVCRMLSFSEGPKPMPAALIAGLRARCDHAGKVIPLEDFEAGQSVQMHSGRFASFIATVTEHSARTFTMNPQSWPIASRRSVFSSRKPSRNTTHIARIMP